MFVGIVQQGMVLDQKGVSAGDDEQQVLDAAKKAAEKLNSQQEGFGEGYVAVAIAVPTEASGATS